MFFFYFPSHCWVFKIYPKMKFLRKKIYCVQQKKSDILANIKTEYSFLDFFIFFKNCKDLVCPLYVTVHIL